VGLQFLARRAHEERAGATATLLPARDGWRLEAQGNGFRGAHTFARQDGETAAAHWLRALAGACATLTPRGVHVESPVGIASEALLEAAWRWPVLLSIHDLGLFCPRPHLLPVTPEGDCFWTAQAGCERCGTAGAPPAVITALLERVRGLVFPSSFLHRAYMERCSAVTMPPCRIIEPAVEIGERGVWRGAAPTLRVAYVGSALPHKGVDLFLAAAPALRAAGLRLSAYGGGDPHWLTALRACGVRCTGYYRAGSLPAHLRRDQADLALLLSRWPESHGLAFDECVAAGVPVVAFDRGALGERLRGGGGALVHPASGLEGLLEAVREIRHRTVSPTPHAIALPTPAGAAALHAALYGDLGWTVG
jgi:glycosyltransferase involved in cell wall biosynthesis